MSDKTNTLDNAHKLMNSIEYDDRLNHLKDEDFEVIWSHIKEHLTAINETR